MISLEQAIANLTCENLDLKEKIKEYEEAFDNIFGQIYSIGAPLNDNVLQYSNKQLVTFSRIADEIKAVR